MNIKVRLCLAISKQ
uniref:Uncharacterized protein n=1 Tax=Arundo donax TaxID=35708 RepID=A0A0A8YTE8_ARUDO